MIFLHSGYRTSSTYIWSRFRRNQNCVAYYEIFHEVLSSISQQQLGSLRPDAWNSQHPPGAPYFLEFLPLIQEQGGVTGFDPILSYGRFVPPSGPSGPVSDAEVAYVRTLIDHAVQRDRIPVLTDTRTLGRVAGFKAAVPGTHAVIYRNLLRQWCSYTDQATCGNPGFLLSLPGLARHGGHDPMIRDLLRMFPVETASTTDTNTFYLFIFLHIYLYSHATASADLVIDVDRLASDASYRAEIEDVFAGQNIRVDFPDTRASTAYSLVTFPCRRGMLEQIQIISDAIIGQMPSERGRAYTATIVADFIDEFERHEFYGKRQRSVLLSTIRERNAAVAAAEDAQRQATESQDERKRLGAEREAALAAVEETRRQAVNLQAERNHLLAERDVAATTLHEGRRKIAALEGELDRSRREMEESVSSAGEAHRAAEALGTDIDQVASNAIVAQRAAEEDRRGADALRSERNAAVWERDALEREHQRLGEERAALSALCDRLTSERDAALAARKNVEHERHLVQTRYDALVHWSVAFHHSTTESASWRLTRPLRWLGLGRPKRPPKPDLS